MRKLNIYYAIMYAGRVKDEVVCYVSHTQEDSLREGEFSVCYVHRMICRGKVDVLYTIMYNGRDTREVECLL